MASAFESLPNELMDIIVDYVDPAEISRLMQCNKGLKKRLEPRLYSSDDARNTAMFWACTHNYTTVIKTLVVNYANSPSTVDVPSNYIPARVKILTLNLVARKSFLEAFNLLLELGALVNDCDKLVSQYQPWYLLRRLCRPTRRELLARLLDVAKISPKYLSKRQLDQTLILLVKSDAPLDLITRVLDLGADPDSPYAIHYYASHNLVCPLSAALLRRSDSLFSLLLERGATIHRTDLWISTRTPLHIPIFAAAHMLPKYGPAVMRLCLEKGADINQRVPVLYSKHSIKHETTPVDVFLGSIGKWSSDNDNDTNGPEEGLRFMLDNGATFDRTPEDLEPYYLSEERYPRRPSSLEILLRKRKPRQMTSPHFVAMIDLLLKNGVVEKQDNSVAVQIMKRARRSVPDKEREFLDSLIAIVGGPEPSEPPEPGILWKTLSLVFPILTLHDHIPLYNERQLPRSGR